MFKAKRKSLYHVLICIIEQIICRILKACFIFTKKYDDEARKCFKENFTTHLTQKVPRKLSK